MTPAINFSLTTKRAKHLQQYQHAYISKRSKNHNWSVNSNLASRIENLVPGSLEAFILSKSNHRRRFFRYVLVHPFFSPPVISEHVLFLQREERVRGRGGGE
jgi:hypothetical protein